jgi:adenylate cyclase
MFMPNATRVKPSASEARLEALMNERLKPGADKAAVDQRIWDLFGEEWAVMFTDLSGFSRQVETFGIIHFLQTIYESLRLLTPCIEANDGILLKVEADSMMVIFRKPHSALAAALDMQATLRVYNKDRAADEKVLLCVGLGFGRVLHIGDHDVFGPEVNAASKLGEDTAKANEILVTDALKTAVDGRFPGVSFSALADAPPGAKKAWNTTYPRT